MIEIGFAIVFVGFLVFVKKCLYPAARLADELKAMYKDQGYWLPNSEEWD